MEQTITKVNNQIFKIRTETEKYKSEFDIIFKEEQLHQEQLEFSKAAEIDNEYKSRNDDMEL